MFWEVRPLIKFVSVDRVKPGVTLARDVYGIDTFTGRIVMLKAGQTLTVSHITKLMGLDLQGVYINEKRISREIIPSESKRELINIFDDYHSHIDSASFGLYIDKIEDANNVLSNLVDTILDSEDLQFDIDSFDFHENFRYNHALSIAVVCIAIAKELRMKKGDIIDLAFAAILHDIGDSAVPRELLDKPAKLSEDEFNVVKTHTTLGYQALLSSSSVSEHVREGVLSHHERYDGSGYPEGLHGKAIPFFARIIAVADVYSALTSARPYRSAYQIAEAIEYIMGNAGRQFDSGVVKAFLKVVSPYPIGSCVKLSSGEKAVVADQHPENPLRPVIFLIDDPTAVIDLYNDKCFYNVVITELLED